MSAINAITPQLRKCMLRLSSDHDGEVVAAAHAIARLLKSNRLDWHDLAQALCLPLPAVCPCNDDRDWRDLLAFCASRMNQLSSREKEFLRSIAKRRSDLTDRQHDWLESIAAKLRSTP
jgi:hypothetical protein